MKERLTRYELGRIQQMHDTQHYMCVDPGYLAKQLARIDLPPRVSRFTLAQRIKELEAEMAKK